MISARTWSRPSLSNNGYEVIDLGKQVPAETIISKAVESNADAIGLSALLVSTSKQMPLIVNELQRRGAEFPVMIGGAAINRRFGGASCSPKPAILRAGCLLLQGCLRRPVDDGCVDGRRSGDLLERIQREAEMELGRR
jgi:5-methyltetrahydrofolate--homocysteine methyltransferase